MFRYHNWCWRIVCLFNAGNQPVVKGGMMETEDWCPICGETLSECECTDQDAHEAYGDYDESGG